MFRHLNGFRSNDFEEIFYLNCGLLTGQSKKTGRLETRIKPIWAIYNKTVPFAKNPLRAHKRFLHYYKDDVEKFTGSTDTKIGGNFNLFLPFERGGLGFNKPKDVPNNITCFQQRYASYLDKQIKEKVDDGCSGTDLLSGLVRKNPPRQQSITIDSHPNLVLQPKIGPMEEHFVSYKTKEKKYPLLSVKYLEDQPEYFIKQPCLKCFREASYTILSKKKVTFWPFQLVEQINRSYKKRPSLGLSFVHKELLRKVERVF